MWATRAKNLLLDALKSNPLRLEGDRERCARVCVPASPRVKPGGTRRGDRGNVDCTPRETAVWFGACLREGSVFFTLFLSRYAAFFSHHKKLEIIWQGGMALYARRCFKDKFLQNLH